MATCAGNGAFARLEQLGVGLGDQQGLVGMEPPPQFPAFQSIPVQVLMGTPGAECARGWEKGE